MNARRISIWTITVLFVLSLTASLAIAQEVPTSGKTSLARATDELSGETALRSKGRTESEPNNRFSQANRLNVGDIVSGVIDGSGDTDYFRIAVPADPWTSYRVLIDIDADINGSELDPVLCLYDRDKTELACNDDAHGLDSLLFHELNAHNATPGPPYYVRVRDFDHPHEGGPDYTYTLSVYEPLLISSSRNGTVAGISFKSSDVLAYYQYPDGNEKWMMFFDASDMGITANLTAVATTHGPDDISFALGRPQELGEGGATWTATPYDILGFSPGPDGHYGPSTVGSVGTGPRYTGADVGLTRKGEQIDALAWPWGVSTVGNATFSGGVVPNPVTQPFIGDRVRDEDISNFPYGRLEFDGSAVPGLQREDVCAADESVNRWYLTIRGSGTVDGMRFTQKDIFVVDYESNRVTGLYWHGPDHGFNYDIDAFDVTANGD